MQEEPAHQSPRERQRCFIVRIDGQLDELIAAHRKTLERRRRARVPLAEAARDLFAQALGVKRQRARARDARQLGLFRAEATERAGAAKESRLTHSGATSSRQSVNCEHCGDPIPEGSRPSRRYCSASCRVLACRARK